jgi:NAD(P)H dehydrogenase (quinone)
MILVTGAAGKTGRAVIRALAKGSEPIRALVHHPDQSQAVKELGVRQVFVGDLLDRTDVVRAVEGVRAIYHMAPNVSPDEVPIGENILTAARSAGVECFVFHSVLHPRVEAMPHHWHKARVEEQLFASGLNFVVLQPTAYMQNVTARWEQISTHGTYPVPYSPQTRLSLVDLEDVAEAAALALGKRDLIGATIELVGTPAMSQLDIVEALSQELGHPVRVEVVPLETWERSARASGMGGISFPR